jgi:lysophospholipase L1-like esterase
VAGNFIADGDSITVGLGEPENGTMGYPGNLTLTPGYWAIHNAAIDGELLSTMVSNFSSHIVPLIQSSPVNAKVAVWGGINDLSNSVSPATVYSDLQSYCAAVHAANALCIVATLPSNQFVDSQRNTVNVSLRANHSFADALVDFSGTPLDCTGCWTNSTWFQSDGVHPTQAAMQTYEVPAFNTAINALP